MKKLAGRIFYDNIVCVKLNINITDREVRPLVESRRHSFLIKFSAHEKKAKTWILREQRHIFQFIRKISNAWSILMRLETTMKRHQTNMNFTKAAYHVRC